MKKGEELRQSICRCCRECINLSLANFNSIFFLAYEYIKAPVNGELLMHTFVFLYMLIFYI